MEGLMIWECRNSFTERPTTKCGV